jgi:hypothetical protein
MSEKEYEFEELVSGSAQKDAPAGDYTKLEEKDNLQDYEGKEICFEGTIAMIPWQHLINMPDTHGSINYINRGEDQVVAYTEKVINCKAKVAVKGTVIKTQGKSKRPGDDEIFTEYQVIADSWECIQYGD